MDLIHHADIIGPRSDINIHQNQVRDYLRSLPLGQNLLNTVSNYCMNVRQKCLFGIAQQIWSTYQGWTTAMLDGARWCQNYLTISLMKSWESMAQQWRLHLKLMQWSSLGMCTWAIAVLLSNPKVDATFDLVGQSIWVALAPKVTKGVHPVLM